MSAVMVGLLRGLRPHVILAGTGAKGGGGRSRRTRELPMGPGSAIEVKAGTFPT